MLDSLLHFCFGMRSYSAPPAPTLYPNTPPTPLYPRIGRITTTPRHPPNTPGSPQTHTHSHTHVGQENVDLPLAGQQQVHIF